MASERPGRDWILVARISGNQPPADSIPVYAGADLDPDAEATNVLRVAGEHCQDCIGIGVKFDPMSGWQWWLECCCRDDEATAASFGALVKAAGSHDTNLERGSTR